MAKCVRATFSPFMVTRNSDDNAFRAVKSGLAVYVPKHVWKEQRDGK